MSYQESPLAYDLSVLANATDADYAAALVEMEQSFEEREFEFCDGCPLLNGLTADERKNLKPKVSRTTDSLHGTVVTMRMVSQNGKSSPELLLGVSTEIYNIGSAVDRIRINAANRTHECQHPTSFPPFLGRYAIKFCQALSKNYINPTKAF